MVVFPALQYLHLSGRVAYCAAVESVLVPVLSQGARIRQGAEKFATEQAGVRGHLYDRGQRLGRRADFGPDYNWPNTGEILSLLLFIDCKWQ